MKLIGSILILVVLSVTPGARAMDDLVDAMVALERALMARLAQQQQRADVATTAFASDGCSGGMSAAWRYLGDLFPPLAAQIGSQPPWEHCCVEHDRQYWRGPGRDGFELRLQADRDLRQCVLRTGQRQQYRLAQRLGVPAEEIIQAFTISADMMFQAVRIGGGPCTGLPWRWGYAWPECNPVRKLDLD